MENQKKFDTSKTKESNVGAKIIDIVQIDHSGRYHIGKPTHPNIKHDNGFLDKFPLRSPTASDLKSYAYWIAKLETAEALRPDLADATAAYRHFLFGKGKDRTFSYERYIENDKNGKEALENIIKDFQYHSQIIGINRENFELTSDPYLVGNNSIYPYPDTENWQKAIGAHAVWVSAKIKITIDPQSGKDIFHAHITLHAEDKYNFNPGALDIATGIPDNENGKFEITGLAHQYMNYSTLTRDATWKEHHYANTETTENDSSRDEKRRPQDNRRIRNRI